MSVSSGGELFFRYYIVQIQSLILWVSLEHNSNIHSFMFSTHLNRCCHKDSFQLMRIFHILVNNDTIHTGQRFFLYRPLANGGKRSIIPATERESRKKGGNHMYYQVSQDFFEKLPNACFGAVAVRGLDNTHDIPQLEQMLAENVAACEAYFAGKKPKETEDILPYRNAFMALGINPNKFLCSIEALLTRIAKGKGFPHINAAVDLGNAVSIKHRLPMGAHDLDTIDEGLDVRLAKEGDTFIPFGSTEEETPDMGEAVYASGSEIRTRRWTWRQSERGKITEETKAILFPIDGFSDVNADEVQAAADELAALLHRFFGDGIEIEVGVVTRDSPRFEFFK